MNIAALMKDFTVRVWNGSCFYYMSVNSFDTWSEFILRNHTGSDRLKAEDLKFVFCSDDNISDSFQSKIEPAHYPYNFSFDFDGLTPIGLIMEIERQGLKFEFFDFYKRNLREVVSKND